jgi:hypothetical protein
MVKRVIMSMVVSVGLVAPAFADMNIAPPVGSLTLDFRTAVWAPANNRSSYTVGNVTATAVQPCRSLLWQDAVDGLGIRGGEQDEINRQEILKIDIAGGMNLAGIWITDIFKRANPPLDPTEGGSDGIETGSVLVNGSMRFDFAGYWDEQLNNGELYVSFGQILNVTTLRFWSSCEANDDYSVAGAVVPIPGAVLLGFLGLGYAGMKLRKSA